MSALARAFVADRRLHIADLLAKEDARRLADHLLARDDWRHVTNGGGQVFEIERHRFAAMDATERERIVQAIHAAASDGFQFRYDTLRVPDYPVSDAVTELDKFTAFLRSPAMLRFFRTITGLPVSYVDAQATLYRSGDFLTGHDDDVAGKHRLAAYVFNLAPVWRTEWGGLLMFHGADGHVERALTPRFNSLNLFGVPQTHSVSMVAPFASGPRLAVTGWLRERPPEPAS